MAKKISELSPVASVDTLDLIAIVDVSTGVTKKATVSQVQSSTAPNGTSGQILTSNGTSGFGTPVTPPGGSLVGTTATQTLTAKTIDAASNTLSNIANAHVSTSANIAYSKLGTGTQSIGAQQYDSTVDTKGTERTREPVNVQTTDATVTTLDSFTLASNTSVIWTVVVAAVKSDNSQAAFYTRTAGFRNASGTVTPVGTTQAGVTLEDDSVWDCTIDNATTTIRCRITGKASTTIRWTVVSQRLEVIP